MKIRPKTAWWTCSPPGLTLPGHHFTCARIIRTLKRMNANAAMNATKKQKSRSLPVATTDCWNQLLIDGPPYEHATWQRSVTDGVRWRVTICCRRWGILPSYDAHGQARR